MLRPSLKAHIFAFGLDVRQLIQVANTQTQRESCKVKSGLEPLYPPFQIRTKVGALAQNWWLC